MKTIIFDLDGTLANINHRLHFIKNGQHDYDSFFKACKDDELQEPIAKLLEFVSWNHIHVIIVSGRSDSVRTESEEWLRKHHVIYKELIMRPTDDLRPDHVLKEEILNGLLAKGHSILFVVDDRQRVVDMWRRRGITCLQCAAWDEEKPMREAKKGLLTLMVGPSGAGKSSWLQANGKAYNIDPSHIISSDQIRMDISGDFRDQTKNDEVFYALHQVVKVRIDNGLSTVIDATNIKRADRLKAVGLAEGSPVRYIVLDRPMLDKKRDGGWRNELGFDLLAKHQQTFNSQLKDILLGDNLPNVTVVDLIQ